MQWNDVTAWLAAAPGLLKLIIGGSLIVIAVLVVFICTKAARWWWRRFLTTISRKVWILFLSMTVFTVAGFVLIASLYDLTQGAAPAIYTGAFFATLGWNFQVIYNLHSRTTEYSLGAISEFEENILEIDRRIRDWMLDHEEIDVKIDFDRIVTGEFVHKCGAGEYKDCLELTRLCRDLLIALNSFAYEIYMDQINYVLAQRYTGGLLYDLFIKYEELFRASLRNFDHEDARRWEIRHTQYLLRRWKIHDFRKEFKELAANAKDRETQRRWERAAKRLFEAP